MSTNFPTAIDTLANPTPTSDTVTIPHSAQHANANDAIEALEAKVGINSSAVTTSHDYKLGEVTGTDKAVGKSASQTLLNKILGAGSKIILGSDAVGDIWYAAASNVLTRLGIGSIGQVLTSDGTKPIWSSPGATNFNYAADSGAANSYVVNLSPALSAYAAGVLVQFKATNANTTTSTVNVNGLGVKTIKKAGGATDLASGDIAAGMIVSLEYDGTNFVMLNPVSGTVNLTSGVYPAGSAANLTNIPDTGFIASVASTTTVTATTTETTVATIAIPGGTLSTNKGIRLRSYFAASLTAVDQSVIFRIKYGGTTISTFTYNPSVAVTESATITIDGYIIGAGTTSSQMSNFTAIQSGYVNAAMTAILNSNGTTAIDSTVSQNLTITIQHEGATNQTTSINTYLVQKVI